MANMVMFQKGDFVIDRKDAYKLDSYPIWRIENGKLLQKFDPELEDGLFIHKSASVVCLLGQPFNMVI